MVYQRKHGMPDDAHDAARRAIEIRSLQKAVEHLLGICAGIIADHRICDEEVRYLENWLHNHPEVVDEWPGRVIAGRVREILDDGLVTAAEAADLLETLRDLGGNRLRETGTAAADFPALPIDDDPSIFFRGMTFCLTGRFMWGTRARCERTILDLDGTVVDTVTKRLDYLVIGSLVEPQWAFTTYGRKIEKAVEYKHGGSEIVIVSEQQWTSALRDACR